MCPTLDPDVRALRQNIYKAINALEKQINLFALRLLRAQLRLNQLQTNPQETQKIYRDPK